MSGVAPVDTGEAPSAGSGAEATPMDGGEANPNTETPAEIEPSETATTVVKVSITASHDGGNIDLISTSEPVISGRTAKVTCTVHVKPGEET